MPTIVGIAGSLRKGSYNAALLRAAVQLAPPGTTVEVGSISGIPLYDGDVEGASGIPDAVRELKERIASADGLLLVTPEYNNSIPGVAGKSFDAEGRLVDEAMRQRLQDFLAGFTQFIERHGRAGA